MGEQAATVSMGGDNCRSTIYESDREGEEVQERLERIEGQLVEVVKRLDRAPLLERLIFRLIEPDAIRWTATAFMLWMSLGAVGLWGVTVQGWGFTAGAGGSSGWFSTPTPDGKPSGKSEELVDDLAGGMEEH